LHIILNHKAGKVPYGQYKEHIQSNILKESNHEKNCTIFNFCSDCRSGCECCPRFRGPAGDGLFSETGLLKTWPDGGPKLAWSVKGLSQPSGYCSVRIIRRGSQRLVLTMLEKALVAIDPDTGKVLWQHEYPQR